MNAFQQFLQINQVILFSLALFFLVLLLAWNLILSVKVKRINRKTTEFYAGNKVSNLEELLLNQAKSIQVLDKDIAELYNISNQINSLASRGFHKIGVIRFNPFKDVGGDQSFSIAILNGKNNGITLSSLYTREGTRIYAKSITVGKSEKYPLTEEEKEAISEAIKPEIKKNNLPLDK
jgi:hypothetical protein